MEPSAASRVHRVVLSPFVRFVNTESSGGIVLLIGTVIALVWANSPFAASYEALWNTDLGITLGSLSFEESLEWWINDALMSVFFFVVGLEIKREILAGELASFQRAALPIAGALGGMVVPASIYLLFNGGGDGARGWGIPMATDIAFALGVLALLGSRVPIGMKVFLTALAIVDDIGAVVVIGVFYTEQLSLLSLGIAALLLGALIVANKAGVSGPGLYLLVGLGVWLAFLKSGVHPTIAGVLVAMTIPAVPRIPPEELLHKSRSSLEQVERLEPSTHDMVVNRDVHAALLDLRRTSKQAQAPTQRLQDGIHPWVTYGIIPLFALANAGVPLPTSPQALTQPVALGIMLGLVLGKQVGITLFAWLAVRLGIAAPLTDASWKGIYALSWLAGIGFTMSIFITGLAFDDPSGVDISKVAILTASIISGVTGYLLLRLLLRPDTEQHQGAGDELSQPGSTSSTDHARRASETP